MDGDDFQTVVTEGAGFVRITVSGPFTRARFGRLVQRIVAEAGSRGETRVLVDLQAVPMNLSTMDRYEMGVAAGRLLVGVKVVVIATRAVVDHFAETVARNRGAVVGVFTEEAAALKWLLGPETPPP
jgi:hypothetical protein